VTWPIGAGAIDRVEAMVGLHRRSPHHRLLTFDGSFIIAAALRPLPNPGVRHGAAVPYNPAVRLGAAVPYNLGVRHGAAVPYNPGVRHGAAVPYNPAVRRGAALPYNSAPILHSRPS